MSDLIDTTEMYLRTIYELEEEGIVPLRARIAERLSQSGPTVSQTVARMERDGLVVVSSDRHLEFTPQGRWEAVRVMRKHRLAECLLMDVIGMPWEDVHDEACRWEHVMSDAVERRLVELLGTPRVSPYGNPIPGLEELTSEAAAPSDAGRPLVSVLDAADAQPARVTVRRIAEPIQRNGELMARLRGAGAIPGGEVEIRSAAGRVELVGSGSTVALSADEASHVMIDER
jgi:DtxR family Mn-dependent transcriptional regulator